MAMLLNRPKNIIKHFLGAKISYNFINNLIKVNYLGASAVKPLGTYFRQFDTFRASELRLSPDDHHQNVASQGMDFPGGKVPYTSYMSLIPESTKTRQPCYRVLSDDGVPVLDSTHELMSKDMATKVYTSMITLQVMDSFMYEAQRQGRISFYMTSLGEESINIGSAAAVSPDDIIFAQYREPGILLWRGYTVQEFANQCFGNKADLGKGRQMPSHYGSKMHNFFTISSPIATQLPQAAGAAYSLKMDNKDACVVAFMGDGCTSQGDFHAGLNFAAVMEVPIVFICRNNGWAISTPITEQFRSDGVVVKGQAYGIRSIRVDGNDAHAVYNVIKAARTMAISEQIPVLVEALTYRVGHHSTSDDSTKYRPVEEIERWKMAKSPIIRFRKWVESNGWWDEQLETELRNKIKTEVIRAIQNAENIGILPISEMFTDVYDEPTKDLGQQQALLRETIERHPQDYPSNTTF